MSSLADMHSELGLFIPGSRSTAETRSTARVCHGLAESAAPPLDGLRVLVAEDDAVNQLLARRMLAEYQSRVTIVGDGREVLRELEGDEYDMLLLDLQMPNLGGLETAARVMQKQSRRPYIIALTADALPETRAACLRAGMDEFLAKPYGRRQLRGVLERGAQWLTATRQA